MAIAAVQRRIKGAVASSVSIAAADGWTTPTTGGLIVVSANSDATVTISGSGWTAGPSVIDGNGAYVWFKISDGSESTITCSPSVSADIVITACEYSGVAATPLDVQNSSTIAGSSGTTTTAASVTTTAAADLILGYALLHGSGSGPNSPSWSNSFTNVLSGNSGTNSAGTCVTFAGELLPSGASGSYSTVCTWTSSASDRQHIIVAFLATAGGTTVNGTASAASTSALTGEASVVRAGAAALTSSSSLTAAAGIVLAGMAALPSVSALAASGGSTVSGTAALPSESSLTSAAVIIRTGVAALSSTSALNGGGSVIVTVTAAVPSTSVLSAVALLRIPATALLASVSALTAAVGNQNQPGQMTTSTTAAAARGRATAATALVSMWP